MDAIITQLAAAGPVGVFAAFLIWERRADRAERLVVDKERVEADKALAASLATLATTIQQVTR
jgi:hypothetical protein